MPSYMMQSAEAPYSVAFFDIWSAHDQMVHGRSLSGHMSAKHDVYKYTVLSLLFLAPFKHLLEWGHIVSFSYNKYKEV
jgi:hypothetical protein